MATQPETDLTYEDLQTFPEDNLRRELIDGELIVTAAPGTRHQDVVAKLTGRLLTYAEQHGGKVLPAPTDVFFTDTSVVEPDVIFIRVDHLDRVEKKVVRSAPDVVVEISSPSTRRLELIRKKELYERYEVPEYWYVDLDADRVELYRLGKKGYGRPALLARGDTLDCEQVPGFSIEIDDLIGPPED